MRALHRHGQSYLSSAQQRDEGKVSDIKLIDRPTTDVPWSSSSSSALQNIGVSNVVGRVRIYGPHFVCTSSWSCPPPSMSANSCAHASSHIMHKINPTQPLCNLCERHASKPKRAGRRDVLVESVIVRGRVKRGYPSCRIRITFEQWLAQNDDTKSLSAATLTRIDNNIPKYHTTQSLRVHCLGIL